MRIRMPRAVLFSSSQQGIFRSHFSGFKRSTNHHTEPHHRRPFLPGGTYMGRGLACFFGQLLLCALLLACWIPSSTFFAHAGHSKLPTKPQSRSDSRPQLLTDDSLKSFNVSATTEPPWAGSRRLVSSDANPHSSSRRPGGTVESKLSSGVPMAALDTGGVSVAVEAAAEQSSSGAGPAKEAEVSEEPLSGKDLERMVRYQDFFENMRHGSGVDFEEVFESLWQKGELQVTDIVRRASLEPKSSPEAAIAGFPATSDAAGAGAAAGEEGTRARVLHARTSMRRMATDSCWSKRERHLYHQASVRNHSSRALIEELVRYAEMHRACTEGISNWEAHFKGENVNPAQASCKYIVPNTPSGLGNHLLSTVAAFTYALLTNRTLLLKHNNVRASLCEPFPASSWRLPWQIEGPVWRQIFGEGVRLGNLTAMAAAGAPLPRIGYMFLEWSYRGPDAVFYCDEGQAVVESIPWLVLHSDQYYVPGLYFVTSFYARLEQLFPDRQPFTHLARYLLHPNNFLWERITRVHRTYFRHASRRVGIQVRTFKDKDHYANERILSCIVNVSRVLPPPVPAAQLAKLFEDGGAAAGAVAAPAGGSALDSVLSNTGPVPVSVFVTSLHRHHYEYIKEAYNEGVAADGSLIALHTESSEGREDHDIAKDRRALTEMWLLSFSDQLLTSDVSTFGYFAAGLAGVAPYMMNNIRGKNPFGINNEKSNRDVCDLAPSSEPCFHFPPRGMVCPSGNWTPGVGVYNKFPFLKRCQDYKHGIRLQ